MRIIMGGYRIGVLLLGLLIFLAAKGGSSEASKEEREILYQTVPTPTFTTEPRPPTNTPGSVQPTNEFPRPSLTVSALPNQATPTAIDLVETPVGGYLPTSESCGVPPSAQALDLVNVRSGPSRAYEVVYKLVFLEVRPIVGRAEHSNWWLITLPGGGFGWVIDNAVSVSGNISVLPTLEAPPIPGGTAIPTATWNPTPRPQCQPLPTFTPFPIGPVDTPQGPAATKSAFETTPQPSTTSGPTAEPETTRTPLQTEDLSTASPSPTTTESATIPPTSTTRSSDENLEPSDPDSSWLLYVGLGLVALGIMMYVGRRIFSK